MFAMDAGTFFVTFFRDFFGTPAILVGIFAMLGAVLLRKKFSEVVSTLFKTIAGFLILSAGSTTLQTPLGSFQVLFQDLFGLSGMLPNNNAFAAWFFNNSVQSLKEVAQLGAIIMVLSTVLNMVLSGLSRFRFVYLSGHVVLYMSIMLAGVLALSDHSGFINLSNAGDYVVVLLGCSVLMACYMVVSSACCMRFVSAIMKQDNVSIAHTGSLSYVTAGWLGEAFYRAQKKRGKKVRSAESVKFPQWLSFFRNSFISMAITMLVVFFIIYVPEGIMYSLDLKTPNPALSPADIQKLGTLFGPNAGSNWLIQMLLDAFTFAAGMEILLYGVRMIIDEIVPAFRGLSQKFIKGSRPSLDAAIVWPHSPNAMLIGFVTSLICGFIGMAITIGAAASGPIDSYVDSQTMQTVEVTLPVIIPGVVPHFFIGSTSGVYGNAKGGVWGAVIAAAVNGLIITFVPYVFIAGGWTPVGSALSWGDTDYLLGVVPGVLSLIGGDAGKALVVLVPMAVYIGLAVDGVILWARNKKVRDAAIAGGYLKPQVATIDAENESVSVAHLT